MRIMNTVKSFLTLGVIIVLALALSAATSVVLIVNGGTGATTAPAAMSNLLGNPLAGNYWINCSSSTACTASPTTVGGLIGGSFNGSGLFAGSVATWFTNATTGNLVFPYSLYLSNFSANVSTTISANGTAQWLPTLLPSATVIGPATLTFPPGITAGTNVSQSSFTPPFLIPAWTTTEFTRSASALTGAATGGVEIFSAEVLGTTTQPLASWLNGGTVALSTTSYLPFSGILAQESTEGVAGVVIPWANGGTVSDLVGYTTGAQPASGALVGTLRVNAASPASGPTFTVALSAAAGIYPDLTHTASVTQGQWIDVQMANAATAVSATLTGVTAALTPAAPATGLLIFGVNGTATASGYYSPYVGLENATETLMRGPIPRAGTIKNMYCIYTTPPGTNAGAVTLVKNGTPQSLSVAIPTTGSGVQIASDTIAGHAVTVAAYDQVDVEYTQTSGTKPVVGSCSAEFD